MSSGLYSHTTRGAGTILTAAIYNADHTNHITNSTPSMIGAYSDSVGEMQTMTSPGGLGSENLAGSLAAELARLRFAINRIVGKTHWYEAPASDIQTLSGAGPLNLVQTGATPLTIRRSENDTTEREARSVQSGSGVGVKFSERIVGGGANNLVELRRYIGTTELDRITAALYTLAISMKLGTTRIDASGFLELSEMTPPSNPAANFLRLYVIDVAGVTKLAYRDSAGTQVVLGAIDVSAITATEAEVKTGTEGSKFIPPSLAGYHEGACKAAGYVDGGVGPTFRAGKFGVTTVTRVSQGLHEITLARAMSAANDYHIDATVNGVTAVTPYPAFTASASVFRVSTIDAVSGLVDNDFSFAVFGKLAP